MTSRLLVGVLGAPHGIRGEMRLKSYTDAPASIARYGPLHAEGRPAPLLVRAWRPIKDDMLVVRFEGIDTREAAAALTNARLFIDRAALPAADEEEFYHADLVGLRAETVAGEMLGSVRGIANFGAGDLVEIVRPGADSLLVPFTKSFVPEVDLGAGRLIVADAALAADADDEADPGQAPP